jgi:hypothetical protein
MSLLLNVIFASHARSTHHKLALDALKHLEGTNMDRWADAIISQHSAYLEGAKAPDDDFKDFKNHVLHVRDNFWGGAVNSAIHWYGQLVDHLRGEEWKDAAYAAGVFSHYYSDPLMPFHTGQTEAEGAVHRAAEWSVTKSYKSLRKLIDEKLGGYPTVDVPNTDDWLGDMVRNGAKLSNQYYELVIDHYNLAVGVKDPPNGFDDVAREAIAKCLAHATIGLARILERAFEESLAAPPEVKLTLPALLATINVPYQQIVKKLADSKDRKEVEAIFREVQETGKALHSLPESERLVRQFHAAEVLKVPLSVLDREKPKPAGSKYVPRAGVAKNNPVATPPAPRVEQPAGAPAQEKRTTMPVAAAPKPAAAKQAEPKAAIATPSLADTVVPVAAAATIPLMTTVKPPGVTLPEVKSVDMPAVVTAEIPEVTSSKSETLKPKSSDSAAKNTKTHARRFYLRLDAPIVDAPSIGPKTATRFQQVGLKTISEFLEADPDEVARKLSTRHITADVLRDWQAQSTLMVDVPGLRGHDAQLLVAADVRDKPSLQASTPRELLDKVLEVAATAHGRSILRDSAVPDLEEVAEWIAASLDDTATKADATVERIESLAGVRG